MKAPEKVYVHPGAHLGMLTLTTIHVDAPGEEVYIRKDALMEWAKEHQEGERQGSYTWSCYQIFIDKLNEM